MERGKLTRVEGAKSESGGQKRSVEYTALTDPNLKVRCMRSLSIDNKGTTSYATSHEASLFAFVMSPTSGVTTRPIR